MFYPLMSKIDTPAQLAKHERRCRVLRRVAEVGDTSYGSHSQADAPPLAPSNQHHHIAPTRNNPVKLFTFLREHDGDSAVKVEASFAFCTHSMIYSQRLSEFFTEAKGSYPL